MQALPWENDVWADTWRMSGHRLDGEGMEEHFRQREQQVPRPWDRREHDKLREMKKRQSGGFDFLKKQQEAFETPWQVHPFFLLCMPTLFLPGQLEELDLGKAKDPSF